MNKDYQLTTLPRSRLFSIDMMAMANKRHHVAILSDLDVTESRRKMQQLRKKGIRFSFTAWLMKTIADTLMQYPDVASFLQTSRKMITFDDIHMTVIIEKERDGQRFPLPLLIRRANQKSVVEITREIKAGKSQTVVSEDIVLAQKSKWSERLYYYLPGFLRRAIWRLLFLQPKKVYRMMGNAVLTSVANLGEFQGWYIHGTVHPISIGVGSIARQPWAVNDEILIRDILKITFLIDHDVVDGAPMARFLHKLSKRLESGYALEQYLPEQQK
jgi:pyruvate/2-oxoglutarate dehydrogenase complex dihydrolipoamide acyltransferase (E2) component